MTPASTPGMQDAGVPPLRVIGTGSLQVQVARILAEASTIEEATPRVLAAIDENRMARQLEELRRAAHALSASLDLQVVLDAVARSAAEALGAPRATVLQRDGDMLRIAGEFDRAGTSARGRSWPVADLPGAEQVLQGEFWTGTLQDVGPALREVTARTGVRAVAMAPVRSGSESFGILALLSRDPRVISDDEMGLLRDIAGLAGLAVGNAESFRLEREHGRRVAALETAKAQFLNLASHELRGPLTVLRGYISMLAEGSLGVLSEPMARIVPVLLAKVGQINSLVDEMLEAARLEDGDNEISPAPADLRELVRRAVRAGAAAAPPGQRIHLDLPDHPVPVNVDAGRLDLAVRNLVDNAIKYSPGGGDVACAVALRDGLALVEVSDHGLGIAPEHIETLFTRFGRIVTAENSHIPGTGLGLHLAREMARMHGGDIAVVSVVGRGSTFTLSLPALDGAG